MKKSSIASAVAVLSVSLGMATSADAALFIKHNTTDIVTEKDKSQNHIKLDSSQIKLNSAGGTQKNGNYLKFQKGQSPMMNEKMNTGTPK